MDSDKIDTAQSQNITSNPSSRFINEAQSKLNQCAQFSIIRKILERPIKSKQKQIPYEIIYQISSFVFCSPLKFSCPVYLPASSNTMSEGSFTIFSKQNSTRLINMRVKKIWTSLGNPDLELNKVMKLASHFYQSLKINTKKIIDHSPSDDQDQKWKIISFQSHYFGILFSTINSYKKQNVINSQVISAFKEMMNCNIAFIVMRDYQKFILIERSNSKQIFQIKLDGKANIELNFEFIKQADKMNIRLASEGFQAYRLVTSIKTRNKSQIIVPSTLQGYTISDTFIS